MIIKTVDGFIVKRQILLLPSQAGALSNCVLSKKQDCKGSCLCYHQNNTHKDIIFVHGMKDGKRTSVKLTDKQFHQMTAHIANMLS